MEKAQPSKNFLKKLLSHLAPLLGTGAVGVCPLCWATSAALLSYLGLGVLIPFWRKIAVAFLLLGLLGFISDYTKHRNPRPLVLYVIGGVILFLGRYVFIVNPPSHVFSGIEGFAGWPIWGAGGLLVVAGVLLNHSLFKKQRP